MYNKYKYEYINKINTLLNVSPPDDTQELEL